MSVSVSASWNSSLIRHFLVAGDDIRSRNVEALQCPRGNAFEIWVKNLLLIIIMCTFYNTARRRQYVFDLIKRRPLHFVSSSAMLLDS